MRITVAGPWLVSAALMAFPGMATLAAQDRPELTPAGELSARVEGLRDRGALRIRGSVVPYDPLTVAVYEQRGFAPLWDRGTVARLLVEIEAADEDGLDPEAYHLGALRGASRRPTSASDLADLDVLATDAFVRLSRDLRFGKVPPQGPADPWNAPWVFGGPEAVANLVATVTSGRVAGVLAESRPQHFAYRGLARALAELRRVEAGGGWEPVPPGPALARDSVDARIPLLRRRLRLSGDMAEADAPGGEGDGSLRFDSALEAGVRAFQHRHGLDEDGVVGNGTLAALNVPVERRIEQVRVNLERARWVSRQLPDTFVVVNVAGARVHVFQGDRVAFETRAIVGTGNAQTPVFTAPMRYVELNPTWTVPPGIVGEVLDAVRRDPGYLQRQGIRVLEGTKPIDRSGVDFSRYTAEDFPYVLRQDAGPANPLGRIKLMLPNEHHVYLHDTPLRELFAEEERLFSHGCVRVEDPVGLAEMVLGDPTRWSRATLEAAIRTGATTAIPLATPVQVFVLYWTAATDPEGVLHFHRDVYERDLAVLAALDAPPAEGTPEARVR